MVAFSRSDSLTLKNLIDIDRLKKIALFGKRFLQYLIKTL